jgi:hypothetical protein
MSTSTVNEEDHKTSSLQAALRHRAALADATPVEFGSVLRHAERGKKRSDRNRKIGALTTSLIVLLGVVGVVKIKGHEPTKVAAADDLRLIPDYLPVADSTLRMDSLFESPLQYTGWNASWATSETSFVTVRTNQVDTYSVLASLDDLIARGEPQKGPVNPKNAEPKFMYWVQQTSTKYWVVNLIMPPDTKWADQIKIARSLSIDPSTGEVTASQPPLGLPKVEGHATADERPLGQWNLIAGNLAISAMRPNPNAPKDVWPYSRPDSSKVTVRGHQGETSQYKDGAQEGGAASVFWVEDGWNLTVTVSGKPSPSVDEALKVAESLRPATDAEWSKLKDGTGIEKPRPPVPGVADVLVGDGEIDGAKWSLSFANAVTTEGCLNIEIDLVGKEQRCIPLNDQPIMWSEIRKVGSAEVLVALLSTAVDTATVTGAREEEHEFVPEGQTVINGASETYVEWLVVPLKAGAAVSIEAFKNLPIAEEANATDGPAADIPSESIGTFPINR